jgi:L-ribulose-5-phosphate 3-epimerase
MKVDAGLTSWPKSITLRAFPADMPLEQALALARDAGFDAVEVNLEPGRECSLDSSDEAVRAVGAAIDACGLKVSAVYSRQQWNYPLTSSDPAVAARCKSIIRRLAACGSLLNSDAVLVVPGAVDNGVFATTREVVRYDIAYDRARDALGEVARTVVEDGYQGMLCVENVWNKFLLSPLEMRRFIDEIDHPSVGVFFDVGNILLYGFPDQWIHILGKRIRRVHVKDFRTEVGTLHGFTGLLQGDVNWPAVAAALRNIGYNSYLTAEVLPAYHYHADRLIYECAAAMDSIMTRADGVQAARSVPPSQRALRP